MADTPDLGAAEKEFNETETSFKETETAYNAAKEAWEADQENEDLKTAFTEHETKYNEIKATYETAKTALDDLKASAKKGYWPEDWREKYVDKQVDKDGKPLSEDAKDKLLKRLLRYASPDAALDGMINAQNKISQGGFVKVPGKDATKEDIAEYRKAMGIPDEPKGYDLTLGNGLVVGDDDKESVNSFLDYAHKSNYTQEQVSAGLNWYYQNIEDQLAAIHEADEQYFADAEDELRQEWGVEYKINKNLLVNFITTDFEEGVGELLIGARLADGTPLANHPGILRGLVAKARALHPESTLVPATGTKAFDAMQDEIAELEKRMGSDPDWHKDKRAQERYMKLIDMRDKNKK